MTPVRLKPAALRSRGKHSTTEPLKQQKTDFFTVFANKTAYLQVWCCSQSVLIYERDPQHFSPAAIPSSVALSHRLGIPSPPGVKSATQKHLNQYPI